MDDQVVVGEYMERSIDDFVRACETHILEEQAKILPDNALIATLCDAVRLTREFAHQNSALWNQPPPAAAAR